MYLDKTWYACSIKEERNIDDPADGLDCAMLSKYVFLEILGIENIRKDKRVEFIGGIRGMSELEARCDMDCVAAFSLKPLTMDHVFAVADQDKIMPPKCTWYEPKPRSGFVVNVFEE